jgi:hypothetical protein
MNIRRRLPFFGAAILLCFLCVRVNGQEKKADDALADFLAHLNWVDESGFLLSVEGVSNDSGPDSVPLTGYVDYQLAYGRTKDFGEFYKLFGTYAHQQTRSQRTGELSLDAPALFEERFFIDNKEKKAEAVLISASWGKSRDWGILWYPRKEVKPDPKNPRIEPPHFRGNYGMLELLPIQQFLIQDVSATKYQDELFNLKLESDRWSSDECEGTWLLAPRNTSRFKFIFAKRFDWLPRRIEIEFTDVPKEKSKLWEVDLEWEKCGDKWLQKRSISRSFFPNRKIVEYQFRFSWKLQSDLSPKELQSLIQSGYLPQSDSFDQTVSWRESFDSVLSGRR